MAVPGRTRMLVGSKPALSEMGEKMILLTVSGERVVVKARREYIGCSHSNGFELSMRSEDRRAYVCVTCRQELSAEYVERIVRLGGE